MSTQVLKGQAALESLVARGMPDWQAKKVLATARLYGLYNFPIDGGYSVMGAKYIEGHFHLGDADFSGVTR